MVGDQYRDKSIKAETRKQRKNNKMPIRTMVQKETVPLPDDWGNFIAHPDNKRELSTFLVEHCNEKSEVVMSRTFHDP